MTEFVSYPLPAPKFPGQSVSRVPSTFSRTNRLLVTPPDVVNRPPTIVFPSVCSAAEVTESLKPTPRLTVKVVSRAPFALIRTSRLLTMSSAWVNAPPTMVEPSGCSVVACAKSFNFVVWLALESLADEAVGEVVAAANDETPTVAATSATNRMVKHRTRT